MALWTVKIGTGGTQKTQERIIDVVINEEFAHSDFSITVQNPISTERTQVKGRLDTCVVDIVRGATRLFTGFIEDVENGADYVKYSGRSFLASLGYSPNSDTDSGTGDTKAEYSGQTGAVICDDLIDQFCHHVNGGATVRYSTLTYSDITFTEVFDGEVKIHGAQKVYDVVKNMVQMYGKDLWSDGTWTGTALTNKNIHIGEKTRGSSGSPYKTLTGGVELAQIPVVKYRSSQAINCLRVLGKGSGKEQIAVWVEDATSIAAIGYVEGSPYNSNLILSEDTANAIGAAIIAAKKDPIEQLHVDPVTYLNDIELGDWVRIIDSYSNINTVKKIKKIVRSHSSQSGDSMRIDLGDKFDNYENIIRDLTKGDVNEEPEMTKQGGALRITANNPPSDYVRHDPGDYYDTTGTFQTKGKGVSTFWAADVRRLGGLNPTNGNFKKALIMIKDSDQTVWHRVGTEYAVYTDAQNESISVDATYIPLGEVILLGKGSDEVEDVYASYESGKSYIYRDVRPIIGTSSTAIGGSSPWEVSGAYSRLVTARPIDMRGEQITKIADLKGSLNADFSLHGSNSADSAWIEFLQWDHSSEQLVINRNIDLYDASTISPRLKFRTPLSEGYTGFYIDYHSVDGLLRFRDASAGTSVFTISDTGRLNLWDDLWMTKGKEINFGTPNTAYIYQDAVSEDLKFYDTVLGATKTLSELAAGGVPSGGVQGDIIYHNGADWVRLAAGTGGYVLQTQGAAANPIWSKGLPASPVQGDIIYYNGSAWTRLAPGSSGNYLKTLGAGNNPVWFNVAAGFVTDPLSNSLDCDGYDVNDIGGLDFRTTLANAYINFDTNDYLRYVCGTDTYEFAINGTNRLTIDTEDINAYERLDMHNYDIINVDDLIFTGSSSYIDLNGGDIQDVQEIRGNTTTPCQLDFRGDNNHYIYYTGSVDNRMGYSTLSAHAFQIGATIISQIKSTGIHMASGKYIKSDSGDLELRAPSGSKIKFVIG